MTDIARLEDAFLQADAAGDRESASVLADEIRRVRSSTWQNTSVPQRKEPGVADYAEDAAKSFALSGLPKGVTGLMGLPGDVQGLVDMGVDYIGSKVGLPSPPQDPSRQPRVNLMPNTQQVRQGVQSVTGDFYKPQYRPGRYTAAVGEALPGAMMGPGGPVRNAIAFGAVPGVASEAAGELTNNNPWAKGGAALVSGGLMGLLTARGAGGAGASVGRAGGGNVDNAVLQQAEDIFQEAQQLGIPITRAEAIQHVTNGGTAFGDLQRVAEGQGGLRDFFAARGPSNRQVAEQVFDTVSPPSQDPFSIGRGVGTAAESVVRDAERARTRAVDPYYRAAANDRVPHPEMQAFISEIDTAIASDRTGIIGQRLAEIRNLLVDRPAQAAVPATRTARETPAGRIYDTTPGRDAIPETYINDIENLDRVRKYVRDRVEMPQIGADAITKEQGANILRTLDELETRMVSASPNFARGRDYYQQITERYIQPLMDGPLGKLANRDQTTKQAIEVLFPKEPITGSAPRIGEAVRAVSSRNPNASRELVRSFLDMKLNDATKAVSRTDGSTAGAGFWKAVMGNPQSAENFQAAISALPGGDRIWPGVERFMTILEAQSRRDPIGSKTAFNQTTQQELKSGSVAGETASTVASVGMKFPQRVKDAIEAWRLGNNVDELARLFTDPRAGREFARLAAAGNPGAVNSSVFRLAMLAKTGSGNQGNQTAAPKD